MNPQPINVLLIEDSPTDARIIHTALARAETGPFNLTHASQLSIGLHYLANGGVDLILCDLMLPDSKGIETVTTVHDRAPRIPIIVLTASDDEELAVQALQRGAQDYLVKGHVQVYPNLLERTMRYAIERKRAEEALRTAHRETAQLLSAIPSILVGVSPDGRITHWNAVAESVFEIAAAHADNRPLVDSGIRWDTARVAQCLEECRRTGKPSSLDEIVFRRPDGTERWLGITVVPIRGEAEGPAGFLLFGADITERKRTETERTRLQTQLGEAQKLETIGRFAGGIAHDFQNFLQVILGFAWLMRARYQDNPELLNDLNEIVHAAESASGMIRQLLAFSRRQALKPTLLEISQTIRNMERVLQQFVGERIRVELELASEPLLVKFDPTALEQVLINLASNARDSMREQGGTLTIRTARVLVDSEFVSARSWAKQGDYIRLSVQDTGGGIDPAIIAHIFEPFFTTKQHGKGTGLGLAVVYGLVKQHEGFIDIETALNVGTTFHLYIPYQDLLHAMQSVTPAPVAVPVRPEQKGTLLVVAPDERERGFAEEILREAGYGVIGAADSSQLVTLLKQRADEIHAVVLDVVATGASGAEVVTHIHAMRPQMRVLLVSGFVDERLRTLESAVSGVRVLQKPYVPAQLVETLRDLLARQATPTPAAVPRASATKPAKPRVLVVDDDLSICRLCERMLRDFCQVSTVSSGRGALEALGREPYDLLLTDLVMPEMDGFALIEEATKRKPGLKIAVMSGSISDQIEDRLRSVLFRGDVLHKPFTAAALQALVRRGH